MNTVKVSDIIVPDGYINSIPRNEKLNRIRRYYKKYGKLDKPIVINEDNFLVDNYVRFLIAKEVEMDEVPYITTQDYYKEYPERGLPITYVVGRFPNCQKEYIWKLTKNISVSVGDRVLVNSKNKQGKIKKSIVSVVRTFTSTNPEYSKHKSVIKVISNEKNKRVVTWKEFAEKHPEYIAKSKKIPSNKMRYLCQCKCSYVFDYRERIRYPHDSPYYAPCQGKCPRCGNGEITFIGTGGNLYPIKWNFTG